MSDGAKKERPTHDRIAVVEKIIQHLQSGLRLNAACIAAGVGRATVWRWEKEDPTHIGRLVQEASRVGFKQRLGPTPPIAECAYAAGLFDGEGTVGIRRGHFSAKNQRRYYQIFAGMSNTSRAMLDWLHGRWNGILSQSEGNTPTSKPWGRWQLSGEHATKFLLDIYPYLIVKRPQADVAFEFRRFVEQGQMGRSEADYTQILDFHARMRHLNQRGTKPVVILPDKP